MGRTFASVLASYLVNRHISHRNFAKRCGMPASYPSRFLAGDAPPEHWIPIMARVLRLPEDERERFHLLADLAASRLSVQRYVQQLEARLARR